MKSLYILSILLVLVHCDVVIGGDDFITLASNLGRMIGCSFYNETNGVAVGWQKIHFTVDGGTTWNASEKIGGAQTQRYQDICLSGNYASVVGYGDSGSLPGSSYSSDGAVTFEQTTENHLRQWWYQVQAIPGTSDGNFVKVGHHADVHWSGQGCAISSDGGKSWAEYDWGLSAIPVSVSFISSSVGWMSGGESPLIPLLNLTTWRSTLSKTTDGGASWTTLEDTFDSGCYYAAVNFVDANVGWKVAVEDSQSIIYKTTDGGATWTQQLIATEVNLMSMKFFDENEGWIVGRYVTMSTLTEIGGHGTYHRGKALHTTNGGKTWTTSTFTGYFLNNVDGFDSSHVYLSGLEESGEGGTIMMYVP